MNNRTVTWNGTTYGHDKQTNRYTKLHRHWAQGATTTLKYENMKTKKYET